MTVAKSVGTAAVLSGSRVRLGVGVGWCEEEFDQTGQDFHNRGKRLDEMIPALRALWQGGWVEYHGTHYDVPACQMNPCPPSPFRSSAAATRPGPAPRLHPLRWVGEHRSRLARTTRAAQVTRKARKRCKPRQAGRAIRSPSTWR